MHNYTQDQIKEFARCQRDAVYFIEKFIKIQHPVLGEVPFKLYPFQKDYIRHLVTHGSVIAKMARQMGKTAMTNAYTLWCSTFNQHRQTLIVNPNYQQSADSISQVRFMHDGLPTWMQPAIDYANRRELVFGNGSHIITANAKQDTIGKGRSLHTVVLDEFAWWTPAQQEWLLTTLVPTLMSTSAMSLIIPSTVRYDASADDQFKLMYLAAERGESMLTPFSATWQNHPERDVPWAEHMKHVMSSVQFRADYECEFIDG